jgi:hypothetical protein
MSVIAIEVAPRTITVSVKKVQRGCGRSMTTTYYLLVKEGNKTLARQQGQFRPGSVRNWMAKWGVRDEDVQWTATAKGGLWEIKYTPHMMIESVTEITKR